MNIQRISIEQLQAAPYNPRVALQPGDAAYARLARSLDEFDLVQPPVWNARTGHIVGGHQRVETWRASLRRPADEIGGLPLAKADRRIDFVLAQRNQHAAEL